MAHRLAFVAYVFEFFSIEKKCTKKMHLRLETHMCLKPLSSHASLPHMSLASLLPLSLLSLIAVVVVVVCGS
jgi:hypothetical protein